jgi:hypothetical protein
VVAAGLVQLEGQGGHPRSEEGRRPTPPRPQHQPPSRSVHHSLSRFLSSLRPTSVDRSVKARVVQTSVSAPPQAMSEWAPRGRRRRGGLAISCWRTHVGVPCHWWRPLWWLELWSGRGIPRRVNEAWVRLRGRGLRILQDRHATSPSDQRAAIPEGEGSVVWR